MTQSKIKITTTPPLPGLTLVNAINAANQALGSWFAGTNDPAGLDGVGPYFVWVDTSTTPALIKRRNAADTEWVVVGRAFADTSVAGGITFENTASGLAATDVQAALDEMAATAGGALQSGNNLSDLGDSSASRDNLGLGDSATRDVGNTAGTVAAGDDARLADAREWTAATVGQAEAEAGTATTNRKWTALRVRQAIASFAVPLSRNISTGNGLTGGGNLSSNRTISVSFGTTANTVAAGNDSRITGAMQRQEIAAGDGASKVGYTPAGVGAVATDVQTKLREFVSVKDFGAVGDGIANDTVSFQTALNHGGEIHLKAGESYRIDEVNATKPTTIVGNGATLISKKINIKTSNFSAKNLTMYPPTFSQSHTGFVCTAHLDDANYENIRFESIHFSGYFYSTNMRARGYSVPEGDPENRVLKGVEIINCTSIAPEGRNSGHFQHIGVDTVLITGCKTYNGQNASSYNFINGNKNIQVIGNYDHNNSYASCEIENGSNDALVVGNNFREQIWIDDSNRVTVSGNTVGTSIYITAETRGADSITVTGNTARNIIALRFGSGGDEPISGLVISGNTTVGEGVRGLFLDLNVIDALVTGNNFNSANSSGQAIVVAAGNRAEDIKITGNKMAGTFAVSGKTEAITEHSNTYIITSAPSVHISRMMRPNEDWLDLPGYYMKSGRYTGSIAPSTTTQVILDIPSVSAYSARVVQLTFIIRDATTNAFSSFKLDSVVRRITTTSAVTLGERYAKVGTVETALTVNITANSSSELAIDISHSRNNNLQVQIIPQISSQMTETA